MSSIERITPAQDCYSLATGGGIGVKLNPAPKVWQINEDKPVRVVTSAGQTRYYPAGTFTIKQPILFSVQKFLSGTEVGTQAIMLYVG